MENIQEFFIKALDMTFMQIVSEDEVGKFAFIQKAEDIEQQFSKFEILALKKNVTGTIGPEDNKLKANQLSNQCYKSIIRKFKTQKKIKEKPKSKIQIIKELFTKHQIIPQDILIDATGYDAYTLRNTIEMMKNPVLTPNPINIEFDENKFEYYLK
jgi:hypothetical protein